MRGNCLVDTIFLDLGLKQACFRKDKKLTSEIDPAAY